MSHLNIAFDRFASVGTVMHYILVISIPDNQARSQKFIMDVWSGAYRQILKIFQ